MDIFQYMLEVVSTQAFASLITITTYVLLFIFMVSLLLNLRNGRDWVRKNRGSALALATLFLLALFLRVNLFGIHFPNHAGDFFYVASAKNMAMHLSYQPCEGFGYCLAPEKPATTYPAILSIVFMVSGPSVETGALVNIVLSSLCVVAMYFASRLVFKNERTALLSSLLLSLLVIHVYYSNTTGPHSSSVLFLLMSVIGFCIFSERRNLSSHLLALSSLALCVSSRLDQWGILIFFAFWYLFGFRGRWKGWKTFFLPLLIFSVIMMPIAMLGYTYGFQESGDARDFGPEFVGGNLGVLAQSLSVSNAGMWLALIGGAVGGVLLLRERRYVPASFLFAIFLYLFMFVSYEYSTTENLRYLLPGVVLGLMTLSYLPSYLQGKVKGGRFPLRVVASLLLVAVFLLPFIYIEETRTPYQQVFYPLYDFTKENRDILNGCYILQCEGRTSWAMLDTKVFVLRYEEGARTDPSRLKELAGGRCVLYVETTNCYRYEDTQEEVRKYHNLTLLKEETYPSVNEYVRLYRVNL